MITVFLVSIIVFLATQVLPGDMAQVIGGKFASAERIAAIKRDLGLNRPVYIQYLDWLYGFVTLDWGDSWILNEPIQSLIQERVIRSLELAGLTMVLVIFIAIPAGVIAGVYRNRLPDLFISSVSYVGISLPEFVTGILLLYFFAGPVFSVFPAGGYVPMNKGIIPWLRHLLLPAITLTVLLTAHIMRLTRSEMITTLRSDYIRSARLKGLTERTVIFKHGLRNAMMPAITELALDLGYLLGGIVIVEQIFAIPGLGRLLLFSIENRDIPLLQTIVVLIATAYVCANLVADLLYAKLDPKIEYGVTE